MGSQIIAVAKPVDHGWIAGWNTHDVPNGKYLLRSIATDASGGVIASRGVTVVVNSR